MSGLSREFRTCCRKQQNKIQPANKKKQARIFQARKYEVHIFQQAASLFPSWPVSSPEPHASRPSAHSFSAPAGQHLPFPFTSHSGQPVNRQMLFCSFGFQDAKTRGAYFFSIQNHRFRLGRPIPPAANPITTSNKTTHFIPAPAGQYLPPPFFSYRPHNPQPANSFLPAWPADALHLFTPLF